MKPTKYFLFLFMMFGVGCTKSTNTTPAAVNPFGGDKGQITIWASEANTADFPIDVSVGGNYVGSISHSLAAAPDCQQANDAVIKFDAEPNAYNLEGKSGSGRIWTGSFTIKSGSCGLVKLQ